MWEDVWTTVIQSDYKYGSTEGWYRLTLQISTLSNRNSSSMQGRSCNIKDWHLRKEQWVVEVETTDVWDQSASQIISSLWNYIWSGTLSLVWDIVSGLGHYIGPGAFLWSKILSMVWDIMSGLGCYLWSGMLSLVWDVICDLGCYFWSRLLFMAWDICMVQDIVHSLGHHVWSGTSI